VSRRVALTGATGFIGRHLSAHLVARGMEVIAVVRPESLHTAPEGAAVVRAPLAAAALREAFRGSGTVVHLAGVVNALDSDTYTAINVEGTRAVAEATLAVGARLVHVSSLAAAGPASAAAPRAEDDLPNPLTPYGKSKLASEQVVTRTPGLAWTILRPGAVYGPGDRALLPLFRMASRGMLPLVGRPDAAYTFVYVGDVVQAVEAAIGARVPGGVCFVGHPRPVTAREILEAIRAAVGRPARVIRVPNALAAVAAAACDIAGRVRGRPLPLNRWRYFELSAEGFVCRVDRLRERLGVVAAIDLAAGLQETAQWYRREGWLK
jgi:nucleoside-diphosphate-sugar epimerase